VAALHLLAVLVTFGGLFLAIFSTVCAASIVVLAFREGGVGAGTLALLCTPYAAYWAAARSTHRRRWVLLVGWVLGLVLSGGMCLASSVVRKMAGPLQAVPAPTDSAAPAPRAPEPPPPPRYAPQYAPQYAPPAGYPAPPPTLAPIYPPN